MIDNRRHIQSRYSKQYHKIPTKSVSQYFPGFTLANLRTRSIVNFDRSSEEPLPYVYVSVKHPFAHIIQNKSCLFDQCEPPVTDGEWVKMSKELVEVLYGTMSEAFAD